MAAKQPLKRYNTTTSAWEGIASGSISDGVTEYGVNEIGLSSISRQAIINGNFDIWQRGNTFNNLTGTKIYTSDRWALDFSTGLLTSSASISHQLLSPSIVYGSSHCLRFSTAGAGSGYTTTTFCRIGQSIENGVRNIVAAGKKINISFWARSSIPNKKIGVYLEQDYGTGGSPSSVDAVNGNYATLTSTWTKYSFSINPTSIVGKTFGTNVDDVLRLQFWYSWGLNYASFFGDTVAENLRSSGDIDITQIQLNTANETMPYDLRPSFVEEGLCNRYNLRLGGSAFTVFGTGEAISATRAYISVPLRTKMRLIPTLTSSVPAAFRLLVNNTTLLTTSISFDGAQSTSDRITFVVDVSSGLSIGQVVLFTASNDSTAYLNLDAEY